MPSTYSNIEPFEGTVSTETTLSLARKSRRVIINNDHATNDLSYKFKDSQTFATLKGSESLAIDFIAKTIIIDGTSVPYRIWVFG
jgi:hypothetical protein